MNQTLDKHIQLLHSLPSTALQTVETVIPLVWEMAGWEGKLHDTFLFSQKSSPPVPRDWEARVHISTLATFQDWRGYETAEAAHVHTLKFRQL